MIFRARHIQLAAAILAISVVLMLAYLRVASTVPVISDGAGNALQAWDMLHGNVLLHGWWTTDVSFWTTELPELMLVEVFTGLRPEAVHVGAALTYTLLVLLAALVARGRARGAPGAVRAVLAAVILLAPEPGVSAVTLLSDPDHVGSAVPVLVLLWLLDFAPRPGDGTLPYAPRKCWWIPVAAGTLLAWAIVGDPLILVVGAGPLAVAGFARAASGLWRLRGEAWATRTRALWFDASLAVAAVAAVGVASAVNRLVPYLGGFQERRLQSAAPPLARVPGDIAHGARSFLLLFGADWRSAAGGLNEVFAFAHLAGVMLVLAAVVVALWRLPRSLKRRTDLAADVLVLAVVANVAAFLLEFTIAHPLTAAHEIGPVAGLGAALAGRVLGGRVLGGSGPRAGVRLVPALAAGTVCSAVMLGFAAARPQAPPANTTLSTWLGEHGLRGGLAGYWQGTSVTLDSGGAVSMLCVTAEPDGRHRVVLAPWRWESDLRLANASAHTANFLVLVPGDAPVTREQAARIFGRPARVYQYGDATIMVWRQNLLRRLGPAADA
jgi:hypothetical protein